MSKRTIFTTISPLPLGISRDVVVEFLHNHQEMIDLNPLVKERHFIKPPSHAAPEEFHCTWYSLTDRISYLPGGLANGDVTYTCAFHDLPNGIQTHCYAPAGLSKSYSLSCRRQELTFFTDIRNKWTLNGSLPGEPNEPVELGLGAPITGLYIREDVDMQCNVVMTSFVKKTLKKSHAALIERLKVKAQIAAAAETHARLSTGLAPSWSTAPIKNKISSRSWTPLTSTSPYPPSRQSFIFALRSNSNTPPEIPSGYSSPPSSPPSSSFPSPQYTLTSPPTYRPSNLPPNPSFQPRHNSVSSPPSCQQHSPPPAYGRDTSSTPQQPSKTQPKYQYPPPTRQPPTPPLNLVPEPLRIHQNSAGSTSSTSSSSGSVAATPAALFRDAHGRVTCAAIKARPSVRYEMAHPDYPQMNPYSDDQVLSGNHAYGGQGFGDVRYDGIKVTATLQGPFFAELEG